MKPNNRLKFGDIVINGWAGDENPRRKGIVVEMEERKVRLTDGKGNYWWLINDDGAKFVIIGNALREEYMGGLKG